MLLLEVIDLQHQGQPDLAGGRLGSAALILQARKMLGLKAANPRLYRRTRDMQETADTDLPPALRIEFHGLDPHLIAVRGTGIVPKRQFPLWRWWAVLPEPFDGLVVHPVARLAQDHPRQLTILQPG